MKTQFQWQQYLLAVSMLYSAETFTAVTVTVSMLASLCVTKTHSHETNVSAIILQYSVIILLVVDVCLFYRMCSNVVEQEE